MSMWQKDSPEPMENSSGYVSNSNSMNPPVKYATIGRKQPGGVKRTSSLLVPQPQPPSSYKANPIPKPKRSLLSAKDARRPLKNELSRPSSRASKSSYNSGSGLGMGLGRPTSRGSRDAHSGKASSRRSGPRASHHKLRRPESRASSKALILRRRESTRRAKSTAGGGPPVRQSTRAGTSSRPSSRGTPRSSGGGQRRTSTATATATSKSSFFSWKPKLTLKRSKSVQAKKDSGRREIRFGDEGQPGVILMRGVEHRRPEGGPPPLRRPANGGPVTSQTLPRPPRRASSPERGPRSQRAASVDLLERRGPGNGAPPSGSPSLASRRSPGKERTTSSRSVSPFKARPPSELSSSPAPRAPIWRADSDGSLSETVTNLSVLTESRQERPRGAGSRSHRTPGRGSGKPAPKASDKSTVMDFIRRKLSIKPKEKPVPVRTKPSSSRRRERASSSSSSPERPRPSGRLRPAKSIDVLTAETRPPPAGQEDEKQYMSLPRGKRRSSGTTLSRKLSNMGWGTLGRPSAGRARDPRDARGPPRDPRDMGGRHAVSMREGRSAVLPHIMPEPERPAPGLPRSMSHSTPLHESERRPEPPRQEQESPDLEPPVPPKLDTSSLRRRPVSPQEEEPIQPILQDRRALSQSQPSLLFPRDEPDAPEEPFTLYANLPFQLPVRLPGSPEPGQRAANAAALKAKRAMSQPSLLEPPAAESPRPPSPPRRSPPRSSADRSDTIYAYNPHRGRPPPQRPHTRTVWRPSITVKRKGILKGRKAGETEAGAPPAGRQQGVLHGIASNIRSVFKHKKNGDDRGVPEGYVAVPGGAVVSERFTNITNTHEERDDVREEEEVHHLGNYSNEEITRVIRDGKDARALVRQRQGSGPSGQLVDPRSGQRRVVHQAGKTRRTVDTEDIHEKTHQNEHGELVTETARTAQQEQFQNIMVPEDGSDCSAEEQHRTTSRHRRHVKDEDMLEYYSVPKGGRLGDGIKLGEGLRYVQENVEEDREGDDNIESLSERMRRLRQLGYKPEGQTLAKTPIEYQEEEKTRRKETHKWLDSHFGSESGQSASSEDGESRRRLAQGRDEVDRRQTSSYEVQQSSSRRGGADQTPTGTWRRDEKYSKQVRHTPEHTNVKETRHTPRGEFERVQVTPVGASPGPRRPSLVSTDTRGESEDPIFASKFSSGKPRGNVRFQASSPERRPSDSGRLSPPTQSPPPPPPPRHRKKGRDKESPMNAAPDNHYASSPIRERFERDPRDGYPSEERRGERRQVREYHFSGGSSDRGNTPISRYEYREQHGSRHGSYSDERDGSQRRYVPESVRARERTASIDELSSSRQSDAERRVRYHHRSTDFLDRRGSDDRRAPPERVTFESQTLPRKPHDYPPSPVSRAPDAGRFGGSMINVSVKNNGRGPAPQKPARLGVQRSSSLYSKDGQDGAFNTGLKSPDIISKIQRTASMRRGEGGEPPEQERMSHTSSSSRSYRASPAAPPAAKKDSFMRGLLKNAPELYNVLHGNERKDSKTPSPRSGLITPPPPLERVQPAGAGSSRSERLRSEESYRSGERPSIVKVQR
ncbi:uncharacterized protein LOC122369478 isoform X2 [Amphibalanus amphitrite]|uniref:uncharacterized protein LOC122369478 isoform X2 n=1 Tax=Amphibalanus amphitrite TaxID=1232801 RepID=UPI001C918ACE|nr:uncharacterized protein LOC122369478 isoform X2 [Amphibalanus amphitrite]